MVCATIKTMSATQKNDPGMPHTLRTPQPDREARVFLRFFNVFAARRHITAYSLEDLRRVWRWMAVALGRRDPVASVTDHHVDGPAGPLQLRFFRPEGVSGPLPAFMWVHGGAFLVGGIDTSDSICRTIASVAKVTVVAVRYRLAPEHDLYAGREDVYAALNWLASHGEEWDIDTTRLAIGGDSAGGNIATAVAQHSVRHNGPKLAMQVLCYPATHVGRTFPSKEENADGFFLTSENMDWMHEVFAASVDLDDPWISPGMAKDELAHMPPAIIVTAGFDPLRDDGLEYVAKLRQVGVPVELLHYPGQFHGFLNFDTVLGAAREGLRRIGLSLRNGLHYQLIMDRTIEVASVPGEDKPGLRATAGEMAAASVILWESLEQWTDTGIGLISPLASRVYRSFVVPWLAPGAWVRSYMSSQLEPLSTRQTYSRATEGR